MVNLSEIVAMNLTTFVSGSAVILMAWLALSFQHQGTPGHYPHPAVAMESAPITTDVDESLVSSISPSH